MSDNSKSLPLTAEELWGTSPDALILVEVGGNVIAANPAAHNLFGYEQDSMMGLSVEDLVPPSRRAVHSEYRETYEEAPHSRPMGTGQRLEGVTAIGEAFSIHVSLAPLGRSSFTIAAIRDMSGWLNAERELEEARRRTDRAEDHERIARGLHDTVIQELFAAGLALQALQPDVEEKLSLRLSQIVHDLDVTTRTIRSVIYDLNSPVHSEEGLRSQTVNLMNDLRDSLGVKPKCHFVGPLDTAVTDDLVNEALAVIRESITNVARHAEATTINLSITVDDKLTIEVVDDGRGLPKKLSHRSGLANLSDRAENKGGVFSVVSAPGGGTVIKWSVPLLGES